MHPRIRSGDTENGEPLLMCGPRVIVYLPDNGRDPGLVKPAMIEHEPTPSEPEWAKPVGQKAVTRR